MNAPAEMAREAPVTERGSPLPLGVRCDPAGANFALFSRHATAIELLIFDSRFAPSPSVRVALDPLVHRTGDIWHVWVRGNLRAKGYAFRAVGPRIPDRGLPFDSKKLLLDPYATLIASRSTLQPAGCDSPLPETAGGAFIGVIAAQAFDWEGVISPRHAWSDTIIYETHVRGFTIDPSSGTQSRGQYLGLIDKIPYLKALGITAVELLPITAFDPVYTGFTGFNGDPAPGTDYWGYNPIALFSPHPAYASAQRLDSAVIDVKTMVRELHRAGIEVILDVVFNHTGEGGAQGPLLSFRGLDNAIYYLLGAERSHYLDYTGCGNTLNCNHPVVRTMIIDCLRHWIVNFHIDGFRFDLAAVLGRGTDGAMLTNPPLLDEIAQDPILRDVKLIAEAWDAGGAFEVGRFAGTRWGEWNSDFRDDVRRFWRGDPGFTGAFSSRLCGSADLFEHDGQTAVKSINFITSHDGFTLQDLVSFSIKHNEANGEGNRDGSDENYSSNFGVEGPSSDPGVGDLRRRQMKNCLASLLLSRGVPMLLGGDEFARTQQGNNNAYCQDNSVSWYDWTLLESNAELFRFVRRLIRLRREYPVLRAERFYTSDDIEWLGPFGQSPDWHGVMNRIGCVVRDANTSLALLFNASAEPSDFFLPGDPSSPWRILIDTSQSPADDTAQEAPILRTHAIARIAPRCTLILAPG